MKKLSSYVLIVVLFGMALPACKDLLTKTPSDKPPKENFFSNKKELTSSINAVYRILWLEFHFETGNDPLGYELDNTTDIGFVRNGNAKEIALGGGSSTSSIVENVWDQLFDGIGKANNLLDNMTKAKEEVSNEFFERIQGEARFLRAYSYFWLTELYGDVPLVTKIPSLEEANIGRTTKEEVVDQIIKDLDFAAQVLPPNWSGDDKGRVTKGAAYALKARVALYNRNYGMAAKAAKQVMDLGKYKLYSSYRDQFQYEGIRSSGVILDAPYKKGTHVHNIPFRAGTRNDGAVSTLVPSQFIVDSYICTDGKPIDKSSVYDPAHPFKNRDPRLDASIVRPQSIFNGYVFETHPDSVKTWRIIGDDSVRVKNLDVTNPYATFTGYIWRKYLSPTDFPEDQSSSSLNWIVIRYAEVLLTYAEAKIENDNIDQSVLDAINKVRARGFGADPVRTGQYPAVTTTNKVKLRKIVRNERKVELALEGFRLFDIRRWKIADEVKNGELIGRPKGTYSTISKAPNIDDQTGHPNYGDLQDLYRDVEPRSFDSNKNYLWPIPQDALDVNENMTQNPGY